jgi:hypothetical protein
VVSETGGQWGQEQDALGLTGLSDEGGIGESVSCAPPGTCTAGGYYPDSTGHEHAFLVTETGGPWGHALKVAAALHAGDPVEITSVSCTALGTCTAGGIYDTTNSEPAFVIAETGGRWGHPRQLPGLAALNIGRQAGVNAISCPTTGHCTAAGYYYYVRARQTRAFAASQS